MSTGEEAAPSFPWDSMVIGLMTGEIGAEMDVNAHINIITVRFLWLAAGYRFVKRGTFYHIRALAGGSTTLCGCYPLAKEEQTNIQRVADICPHCLDLYNKDE